MSDMVKADTNDLFRFFDNGTSYHQSLATIFGELEAAQAAAGGRTGFAPPNRWVEPFRFLVGRAAYDNEYVSTVHESLQSYAASLPSGLGGVATTITAPGWAVDSALANRGLTLDGDEALEELLLTVLSDDQLDDYVMLVAAGVPPLQAEMIVSRTDDEAQRFVLGVRLADLNARIDAFAGPPNDPALDALVSERNRIINEYIGTDRPWSYDPHVTAVAIQNGLTYEQADFAITTSTIDSLTAEIDNWSGHPLDPNLEAMRQERLEQIEHLTEGDADLTYAVLRQTNGGAPAADALMDGVADVYGDQNLSVILTELNDRLPADGSEPVFDPIGMALQATFVENAEEFTGADISEIDVFTAVIAQEQGETYNTIVAMISLDQQSDEPQMEWQGELPTYLDVPIESGREAAFMLMADQEGLFWEMETALQGDIDRYDGKLSDSDWQKVLDNPSEFSAQAVAIARFFEANPDEWSMFDTARDGGVALSGLAQGEYVVGDGDNIASFADIQQYVVNNDVYEALVGAVGGENPLLVDLDGDGRFSEGEFETALADIELAMVSGGGEEYQGLADAVQFALDTDMLEVPDDRAWYETVGDGIYRISSLAPGSPTWMYRMATDPEGVLDDQWSFAKGAGNAVVGLGLFAYDLSTVSPFGPGFWVESWRVGGDMSEHRGMQLVQAAPHLAEAGLSLVWGTPQYNAALEEVRRSGTWDSHAGRNLLLTVADVDGFVENPAEWAGQFAPDVIITALTGGGGTISRIGTTGSRLANGTRRFLTSVSSGGLRLTTGNALRNTAVRLRNLPTQWQHFRHMQRLPNDGSLYMLMPDDPALINAAKRPDINPDGVYDVVAHGNADLIRWDMPNGQTRMSPQEAADFIRRQPGYDGGPVRLLSCSTGCRPDGFAQQLADILDVPVYAPDQLLWTYPDGTMRVASKTVDPLSGRPTATNPADGHFRPFPPRSDGRSGVFEGLNGPDIAGPDGVQPTFAGIRLGDGSMSTVDHLIDLQGASSVVGQINTAFGQRPPSIAEVIRHVPEDATLRRLTPVAGKSQVGIEFKWVDEGGVTNRLRFHDADPSHPGSNSAQGWTARWQRGGRYYDPQSESFAPRNAHREASAHYDPGVANNTHIPIETPPSDLIEDMRPQRG